MADLSNRDGIMKLIKLRYGPCDGMEFADDRNLGSVYVSVFTDSGELSHYIYIRSDDDRYYHYDGIDTSCENICKCKYPARWITTDKECAYCNKVILDVRPE